MEKGYKNIVYLFVLILVLVPIGFRDYFSSFRRDFVTHFHFGLMAIWCMIIIVQPVLISKRKQGLHKLIGRGSYLITPLIITSMVMMMAVSFKASAGQVTIEENLSYLFFPSTQTFLFGLFYLLAMKHRKTPRIHMRYIIVSSVTLLGPTVGRIDFNSIGLGGLDMDLIAQELVLLFLLASDMRNRKPARYYAAGLLATVAVHVLLLVEFQNSNLWYTLAGLVVGN